MQFPPVIIPQYPINPINPTFRVSLGDRQGTIHSPAPWLHAIGSLVATDSFGGRPWSRRGQRCSNPCARGRRDHSLGLRCWDMLGWWSLKFMLRKLELDMPKLSAMCWLYEDILYIYATPKQIYLFHCFSLTPPIPPEAPFWQKICCHICLLEMQKETLGTWEEPSLQSIWFEEKCCYRKMPLTSYKSALKPKYSLK